MEAGQIPGVAKPRASRARRIWRICYWCVVLAGAWGILLMLRRAPAPLVTVSPEEAQSAAQKLQALAAPPQPALSSGEPQRITLTEEEVNSFLAERMLLAGGGAGTQAPSGPGIGTMRDLKVKLKGDQASIFALFNLAGKDLTLEMEGRLSVVGGYLRFEPAGGRLGDLALPQAALDLVVSRIFESAEGRESFRMPPGIRDVRVENGQLVIVRQ